MENKSELQQNSMKNDEVVNQAKIERYKFILSEMGRLNENTHRHTKYLLTLFPTLASAALALKYGVGGLQLPAQVVPILILAILVVLTMVSVFSIVSVMSDLMSWLDYRSEEANLIKSMGGTFRSLPKFRNFWRWYETYLIFFIVFYLICCWSLYVIYL